MSIVITVTPGYDWLNGDEPTAQKLNLTANPDVQISGAGTGDFSTNTSTSTANEAVLFADTTGKLGGRSKVTITPPATGSTITIIDGKTLTVTKTLNLTGTDGTTMTFPSTNATIARTDAANTFTGASTGTSWNMTTPVITGGLTASGSGSNDFSGSTGTFKTSTGAATFGGSSNTFTNEITPNQTKGIVGTTTNNNAQAGSVGEYIESVLAAASAVSITSGGVKTVTSISLTAGDWMISQVVRYIPAGIITDAASAISTTTNTLPATDNLWVAYGPGQTGSANPLAITGPTIRQSLSGTTTIYLIEYADFTSTCTAHGAIRAWRMR